MAEAVVLAGVGWVASPIISRLLNEGFTNLGIDMKDRIEKLEAIIVPQFQEVIDAAERSGQKSKFEKWLRRLKAAMYEAEDTLDLYKYHLLKQEVEHGGSTIKKISGMFSSGLPKKKLRESLNKLEKIALEAKELRDLLGKQPQSNPSDSIKEPMVTTSKPPLHDIIGRDVDRDYLLHQLLEPVGSEPQSSNVRCYSVHSIVGAGGAGKTTLAQLIYNHERVIKEFDLRIWLAMTRGLDLSLHTQIMVEAASENTCPSLASLDVLQNKLISYIGSKKVLIVMDDVWWDETMNEHKWEQFVAPLANVKTGSKILLTSRTVKMPKVLLPQKSMPLKELEEDHFLSLFMHHAFGGVEINSSHSLQRLKGIGEKIAKKLSRSPLAAKAVASRLSKKLDERFWRETLERDMLHDTMQSLLWSYQNLDAPIQRCFSYCGIFPKGHRFYMKKMVELWVAEGFIEISSKRMEDVGEDYFRELLSVFFFQIENDPGFMGIEYGMHDLFHDLAERVSKDDCFRIEDGQDGEIPLITRHLSVQGECFIEYSPSVEKLENLRTVIFIYPVSDDVINSFLKRIGKFTKLRVLQFSSWCFCTLPNSVGELVHLRYLDLGGTKVAVLPTSLQKLYSLQTLKLNYMVTNLPINLNKLTNLRHLVSPGDVDLISSLSEIGKLTSLQKLHSFEVKNEKGYEIGQLKRMNEIGGSVTIRGLKNVESKEQAAEAKLEDKKYVERLSLIWDDYGAMNRSNSHSDVLEGLKPHPNLKALTIKGYQSSIYPSWMSQAGCLENLDSLELSNCPFLEVLPPVSTLFPCFDNLSIHSLPKLTHLPVFPPSLKQLYIRDCLSLVFSEENLQKDDYKTRFLVTVQNSQFKFLLETIPTTRNCIRESLLAECKELRAVMELDNHSRVDDIDMLVNNLKRTEIPREGSIWEALHVLVELRIEYIYSKKEKNPFIAPSGLETLVINSCYITDEALLYCLVQLTCLKSLSLYGIRTITALPPEEVLRQMVALNRLCIMHCNCLISIGGIYALVAIKSLKIWHCACLEIPGEEGRHTLPPSLESIEIKGCDAIKHFQVRDMPSLSSAIFENCQQLKSIVLTNVASLKRLEIRSCFELVELIFSDTLISLVNLEIMHSINMQPFFTSSMVAWPSLKQLKMSSLTMLGKLPRDALASLETLDITHSSEALFNEEILGNLTSLRYFTLEDWKVQALPPVMKNLSSLRSIWLRDCPELLSLPDMPERVDYLGLSKCPAIASLPDLPKSLQCLFIYGCPVLKSRCQEPDGVDWPKILHVRERDIK